MAKSSGRPLSPGRGRPYHAGVRLWRTDGLVIADRLEAPSGAAAQAHGLLGRASLPTGGGMLLPATGRVTTVGMRFPLDLLWLDSFSRVAARTAFLYPGVTLPAPAGAVWVVELPGGTISQLGLGLGDELRLG